MRFGRGIRKLDETLVCGGRVTLRGSRFAPSLHPSFYATFGRTWGGRKGILFKTGNRSIFRCGKAAIVSRVCASTDSVSVACLSKSRLATEPRKRHGCHHQAGRADNQKHAVRRHVKYAAKREEKDAAKEARHEAQSICGAEHAAT